MYRQSPVSALTDRLTQVEELLQTRRRLEQRIGHVEAERLDLEDQLEEAEAAIEAEQRGFARLEGRTLSSILFALTGSREVRLAEAEKNILASKLMYDNVVAQLSALDEERDRLREKLTSFRDTESSRRQLLEELLNLLNGHPEAFDLLPPNIQRFFNNRIAATSPGRDLELLPGSSPGLAFEGTPTSMKQDFEEAIEAAETALAGLSSLRECLPRDPNEDLATLAPRLDEVPGRVATAQRSLTSFTREAIDVYLLAPSAERFGENVLEGILSDATSQFRTHRAAEEVDQACKRLNKYLVNLKERVETAD